MNQLTNVIKLSVLFLVGVFLAACAGTGTMNSTAASPQKEQLLTQAGFVVKTATTPKQQQQLAALPGNHVSAVKYKGKPYYAYPAGSGNPVHTGGPVDLAPKAMAPPTITHNYHRYFNIGMPGWIAFISGDIRLHGFTSNGGVDFGQIVTDVAGIASNSVEARKGRFGVYGDL